MQRETIEEMSEEQVRQLLVDHERKELLRFVTVGSVDDGKSTLIGRLLHDTDGVYEDQLAAVREASSMEGSEIDFSLITDGLKAEREQGITIDVAYRYFTTARRKFIIADTPGHVQYTRNMATGASTADVAIILLDARLGVLPQSRRHAWITSLLGIRHLAVAVNKMDLVDYDRETYERHEAEFRSFADRLDFEAVTFFPISAVKGDNVVGPSERTPWYEGPSVLEFLETVPLPRREQGPMRLPVQTVLRPNLNYRGFAGALSSGAVKPGDDVIVLPQRTEAKVRSIDLYGKELESAWAPMSVTVRLDREVDVSRGDMIVPAHAVPDVRRTLDAMVVWLGERPHDPAKTYLIKHTSRHVRARLPKVAWRLDMSTLDEVEVPHLELNDIGRVRVEAHQPLYADAYRENRRTGAFIVVDTLTNNTVGAGMILPRVERGQAAEEEDAQARREVSPSERVERTGQKGAVLWLSGLPASGKSSLAFAVERALFDREGLVHVLDPDDFAGADGSATETSPDATALAQMARALADAGMVAVVSFVSGDPDGRARAREIVGDDRFLEVHVDTPAEVCRARDTRGVWQGVEAGEMAGVPGVDAPFAGPDRPALTVEPAASSREEMVQAVLALLTERGVLKDR